MKKLFFLILGSIPLGACLPDDAYRMKYSQQEIYLRHSIPLSAGESNAAAEKNLERIPYNSKTQNNGKQVERKTVGSTMKFYGDENYAGVEKVKRQQS